MKKVCISMIACLHAIVALSDNTPEMNYKNPNYPVADRVDDLLKRMTLEEKVFQMCALRLGEGDEIFQSSGEYAIETIREQMGKHGVGHVSCPTTDMRALQSAQTINEIQSVAVKETRLGIPALINDEALHGCKGKGATSYPQSIALSCTWDLPLMRRIGVAIGQETFSRGIRQVLSPTLDLARDPRHGRMEETYGEDPFLASRFGVEYIKGVQEKGVVCAPKHFVANFVADGGRDAGNIALSERELREIHLVPYKAAIIEAKAKSIMAAYNAIDGVPCSANPWLLTDVLRGEWGFAGFVVSDWSGVNHTVGYHRVAQSLEDAAVLCAKAGLDVDLPRIKSYYHLIRMVEEGKIEEASIDVNVKRILTVKFEMGLFENPYVDEKQASIYETSSPFSDLAREAALKSIVLLKNEKNVLPLTAKKIAVVGPNADKLQLGGYSARGVQGLTPLQAIQEYAGKEIEVTYAKGCDLVGTDTSGYTEAIRVVREADACVLVLGGQYGVTGGETKDRVDLALMGVQRDLIHAISALGKPVVVVLIDGRPALMSDWIDKVDGVFCMFFAGQEGGRALADLLFGKENPSGKLTVSIPRNTGDLPMCQLQRPYGREGRIVENKETPEDRYNPLFPFGYGLSYTTYQYKNVKLDKERYKKGEDIEITVEVSNTGESEGEEIVQLYLTDLYCRISQPRKKLKAFQRIRIKAGETRMASFKLPAEELGFLNEAFEIDVESGEFELFVGTNCLNGVSQSFWVD